MYFKDYISFVLNTFRYNVKTRIFLDQLEEEINKIFSGLLFLISVVSFIIGFVSGMNTFKMLSSYSILLSNIETIVSKGIINTTLLEVAPFITFIMYLGQYVIPTSIQIYKIKESGHFDSFNVTGINTVSYVCLSKILATSLFLPVICFFCCLCILLGGVLSCFFEGLDTNVDVRTFIFGYISIYNRKYIILCFLKIFLFCFIACSIAAYVGCYHEKKNNEDVSKVGISCFSSCVYAFLLCDFVLDVIFFKLLN